MELAALNEAVSSWILQYSQLLLLLILLLLTAGLIIFIRIIIKLNKLTKIYQVLLSGEKHYNLEELMLENNRMIKEAYRRLDDIDQVLSRQEVFNSHTLRNVGMIRFNAFPNVGSDQSFALALLDDNKNGIVISSLYGRELSQVYGKPIKNGQSSYILSDEERQAIDEAIKNRLT